MSKLIDGIPLCIEFRVFVKYTIPPYKYGRNIYREKKTLMEKNGETKGMEEY